MREAGLFGNSYVIRVPLLKKCSIFRTFLFGRFACDVGKTERYSAIMRMSATTAAWSLGWMPPTVSTPASQIRDGLPIGRGRGHDTKR